MCVCVGQDSSVGIATRHELDGLGIESWWGWFSIPIQTSPGAHPASDIVGTGSFLGVKQLRRGVYHPPPYIVKVKESVKLYICSPSGPTLPVIGGTLPLTLPFLSYIYLIFCAFTLCTPNNGSMLQSAPSKLLMSSVSVPRLPSISMWSIWLSVIPSWDHQICLWILLCGKYVLLVVIYAYRQN